MEKQHWYLHADLDAFFASVEQLDHPEYRGKPVIVGGLPGDLRSVVSTASYEARKFGVHSAMPTKEAYRLCPQGIYLRGNHHRYEEVSWQIMQIFSRFSPDVQQMSIDEAFIDLTGTERLFGPPEETALKIKEAVKKETGLNISIGLAQNKYFAKLSSDINKPNGFYFMKPGTETNYMLSIPIEKIWGIGKKTAERIKNSGIRTTKELYEKDITTLTFLYGENTASFLYNVLRGNCDDVFGTEAKSHSISNERTFPFDITDFYASETALLELAHTVMFRLLREEMKSKTITLKIRYDDFSTVSARQTFETDILTLDSFFEKIRDLFEKKCDRTRGIRLLGVGFDNVHKEESTYQQNLFDDGQKKKQAIEKAILNIEQKFPDIRVKKARLIKPETKSILCFCFLIFSLLYSGKAFAKSTKLDYEPQEILPLPGESPAQLFNIKKNDHKLEITSSGYWKTEISEISSLSLGNENIGFSFGIPIFKQDVNLSFSMEYDNQWFFDALFADEFKQNTLTMGYKGKSTVKKAVLSNRNIIYPTTYSSSVFNMNPNGGFAQSPGFYLNLANDIWAADFMIRYDMLTRHENIYYGKNQVMDFYINPGDFVSDRFFYIPKEYITQIKEVFIENENGDFINTSGRHFSKLSDSSYLVISSENMIVLSRDAVTRPQNKEKPYILITFQNEKTIEELKLSLGSFSEKNTFLGNIQETFGSEKKYPLKSIYPQITDHFSNGIEALILQTSAKFSPFQISSIYDSGLASDADFSIISRSSETKIKELNINTLDDEFIFSGSSFLDDKHQFLQVYGEENELQNKFFPFAMISPEIYIFDEADSDAAILMRNYSPISFFQIPSTASQGSIFITINGIPEYNYSFEQKTGIIFIAQEIKDTDKIIISWNEENNDYNSGAISAASGFKINLTPEWKFDFDITTTLPLTYSENTTFNESQASGYASLNQGIYYETNKFKTQNNISLSASNENLQGLKHVYSSGKNIPETFYHSQNSGFQSGKINHIGNINLERAVFVSPGNLIGISQKDISGYAIPFEIEFTNQISTDNISFTAGDIKLKDSLICQTFKIAIKPIFESFPEQISDYDIFLGLGVNATDKNINIENNDFPFWNITEQINLSNKNWQIVTIDLDDETRAKLSANHDLRIYFIEKGETKKSKGILLAGPYETEKKSLYTKSSENISIKTITKEDNFIPSKGLFNKTTNYKTSIYWTKELSLDSDYFVSAGDYFYKSDFSSYNKICFNLNIKKLIKNDISNHSFFFQLKQNNEIILDVEFSEEIIDSLHKNEWLTFEIDQKNNILFINNEKIPDNFYTIRFYEKRPPSEFLFSFNGFSEGEIEFDSIYYSESKSSFFLKDNFQAEYKNEESLWTINDYSVINNVLFNLQAYGNSSLNDNFSLEDSYLFSKAGITITEVELAGDFKISNTGNVNAGHSLKTKNGKQNFLSLQEEFRFDSFENNQNTTAKKREIKSSLIDLKIPIYLSASSIQKTTYNDYSSINEDTIGFNTKFINTEVKYKSEEKTPPENFQSQDYFKSYTELDKKLFAFGLDYATSRSQYFQTSLRLNFPWKNFSPKISYSLASKYKSNTNTTISDDELFSMEIPFKILNQSFSILWDKKTGDTEEYSKGGNFSKDSNYLFNIQEDRTDFYYALPIYDLFSEQSGNFYSGEYTIKWNRPHRNSLSDFYLPSSLLFKTGRIFRKEENISDILQFKFITNFESFNLFGNESKLKFFPWYNQDEFIASSEIIVKMPKEKPEASVTTVSAYGQSIFFIKTDTSLSASVDFLYSTTSEWSERNTLSFKWLGKKSPLEDCIKWFANTKNIESKITRKENLNIELGFLDDDLFQNISVSHNCNVQFQKYYSVYSDTSIMFNNQVSKGSIFSLNITLGGKITY